MFFPRAVATNNDKLNVLNIYFLTFLKARILKSSCFDKAMGSRDEPLLASSGGSWHSLACSCITLCPHHHTVFFPVCLCLPLSVFLLKTSITGFGTTLIQYDLILTNYICKDTISKQSHILRFHVDINLEWHYSTYYANNLRLTDTVWDRSDLPSLLPIVLGSSFSPTICLSTYVYILPFWTTDILTGGRDYILLILYHRVYLKLMLYMFD